jgi:hypothetical protein
MERPTYTFIVHADEEPVLRLALAVYRDDLGHEEHDVRRVAEEVIARLASAEHQEIPLDAASMKVTWSALHMLLDDSGRSQSDDRERLRALLDRLPGEHDIRAIDLDTELGRR